MFSVVLIPNCFRRRLYVRYTATGQDGGYATVRMDIMEDLKVSIPKEKYKPIHFGTGSAAGIAGRWRCRYANTFQTPKILRRLFPGRKSKIQKNKRWFELWFRLLIFLSLSADIPKGSRIHDFSKNIVAIR